MEGEIIEDLGETVATFRSLHRGMGSVFLVPQPGRRYHARLFSGHTVDLPLPDTAGIVMTVQPVRDDSLAMQLYFPPEMVRRGESFHLVAQSRGVYAAAWEITAARTRIAMRLPVDQLQTGIARFTLFTGDGIPCNERLVFVDKEDGIGLKVKPLPPTPSPKGRGSVLSEGTGVSAFPRDNGDVAAPLSFGEGKGVRLLLQALDVGGLPVQGVFTVSVTDSLYGSHDTRDATLRSQMLLSSDLKGKVENPGWYFQDRDSMRLQALDLVMQTHGWSGYSWDDVHNTKKADLQYTPELDYRISGRVTNLRGAVTKDVSVTYLAQGAVTLAGDTVTDTQGRFGFDHLLPLENTVVSLIAKHRKGKRNALGLGIELDRQPQTPSPPVAALPRSGSSTTREEQLAMYRMQKLSDEHWLDSLLKRTDTKMIKEVTIEGKR
ncbi:MAG: carboxypeptidase-like regulatory domain-containing protein, partial [Bacteroidales bacterium]|nr:carboxypeptidase-like regulatory domain-containing protein [Bacteroidales bacterium]